MLVKFHKYQGTGNDFVMIDNRSAGIKLTTAQIAQLCHRRFGIGADGLILLENEPGFDFKMVYYNSDGRESSMCGNGGRCLVKFAHHIGAIQQQATFLAIDGPHEATILANGDVSLKMKDVAVVEARENDAFVLNTGSPHFVQLVQRVGEYAVVENARGIRYNDEFKNDGINVNFVEVTGQNNIAVRTYERGVEDETYSCGTGVVASAIALSVKNKQPLQQVHITTPGGQLQVQFTTTPAGYEQVYLIGPAEKVFEGEVTV